MKHVVIVLLLMFSCAVFADEVIPPKPTHYFNDYTNVVSPATAEVLDKKLANFERESSNQFVVAVFPKMQSDSSLDDYTLRVANSWQVGQKDKSNGVVLFVFIQDRKMRLQVGYGLESALSNATCKNIIENEIKPQFRNGDFDGGLNSGVTAIIAAIKENAVVGRLANKNVAALTQIRNQREVTENLEVQKQSKERLSDETNFILAAVAILILLILSLTVTGVILGLKEKVTVYSGKSDLIVSCILAVLISFIVVAIYSADSHSKQFILGLGTVIGLFLIVSAATSYRANLKSVRKTILVVVTKIALAGFVVLLTLILLSCLKSGIISSNKASLLDGYSAEEREKIRKHKKEAATSFLAAGFAAAAIYPLQKLCKKLVK